MQFFECPVLSAALFRIAFPFFMKGGIGREDAHCLVSKMTIYVARAIPAFRGGSDGRSTCAWNLAHCDGPVLGTGVSGSVW